MSNGQWLYDVDAISYVSHTFFSNLFSLIKLIRYVDIILQLNIIHGLSVEDIVFLSANSHYWYLKIIKILLKCINKYLSNIFSILNTYWIYIIHKLFLNSNFWWLSLKDIRLENSYSQVTVTFVL